ncbi:MAG: hypothetical protein OXL98_11815 [Acidimicrobiaceae bacterium]|nr:hypothetical protein [Acidimicrobiaceae bacterium]
MLEYARPEGEGTTADGASADADGELHDDHSEWDDYVPEGIHISEAERQRLRGEHERYLAELIEEFGEPTPEEMARAEAYWRPVREHFRKRADA